MAAMISASFLFDGGDGVLKGRRMRRDGDYIQV